MTAPCFSRLLPLSAVMLLTGCATMATQPVLNYESAALMRSVQVEGRGEFETVPQYKERYAKALDAAFEGPSPMRFDYSWKVRRHPDDMTFNGSMTMTANPLRVNLSMHEIAFDDGCDVGCAAYQPLGAQTFWMRNAIPMTTAPLGDGRGEDASYITFEGASVPVIRHNIANMIATDPASPLRFLVVNYDLSSGLGTTQYRVSGPEARSFEQNAVFQFDFMPIYPFVRRGQMRLAQVGTKTVEVYYGSLIGYKVFDQATGKVYAQRY